MRLFLFRFTAPLRGHKAVTVREQPDDTADAIGRRAVNAVVALYAFGMENMPEYDGLECLGISDGLSTVGWGGLLKGARSGLRIEAEV